MKCINCEVEVDDSLAHCPLCFKHINSETTENNEYPIYSDHKKYRVPTWLRVMLFIILSVGAVTTVINILTWNGVLWSLVVNSSLLYLWILLKNTIAGRTNAGNRLLAQLGGATFLFLSIDIVDGGLGWSVNYVIPILITAFTIVITSISAGSRLKWRDYSSHLVTLLLLGLVPLIFYMLNIVTVSWPSITAAVYTLLTFSAFLFFSFRRFSRELLKIFHL